MQFPRQPFPDFLCNRFAPCVLCVCSEEMMAQNPKLQETIVSEWNRLTSDRAKVIRLVFAHRIPNMNTIFEELLDMRKVYSNTQPFFFLNSEPRPFRNTELLSLQLLRQRLFEIVFMPDYCFPDVPVAVIHFIRDHENAMRGVPDFPKWVAKRISEIRPFVVRERQDVCESLGRFFDEVVMAGLETSVKKLREDFDRVQKSWSRPTRAGAVPSEAEIICKFYADSLFQRREFEGARQVYEQLFEGSIARDARIMCALAMIAGGGSESVIVECLTAGLKGNKNIIQVLALLLARFKVKRNFQNWKKVQKVTSHFPILIPFIFEQKCFILQERHAALSFFAAAAKYEGLECKEYATRCLWRAWCSSRRSGFDLLNQILVEDIAKKSNGINMDRVIEEMLTHSRNIYHPDVLGEHIMKVTKTTSIPCGFVDVKVLKCKSYGFPCCAPDGVVSSETWPRMAQQMFGAFDREKFFNYDVFKRLECAVGEELPLTVFIKSRCPMFPFSNLSLMIDPQSKCNVSSTEIEYPTTSRTNLSFTPQEAGKLEVLGIQFDWLTLRCHCLFDKPITFTCYADSPMISVDADVPKTALVDGEIIEINIVIKNGSIPLKCLAMMTQGTVQFNVLEPMNEELLGQRFLKPLAEHEEFRVRLAVCGIYQSHLETQSLNIMFPFWTHNPPARYKCVSLTFHVRPAVEFPLFYCDSEVVAQPPYGSTALGFTSKHFCPEIYMTSLTDEKCQLCLISHTSSFPAFVIPDFCQPFVADRDELLFWYKTDKSVLFTPTPGIDALVTVSISCASPNNYCLTLRNISTRRVRDIKISLVESQDVITFILSGTGVKVIDALDPGETYSYRFGLVPLTPVAKPILMLTGENFAMTHEISFQAPSI